MNIAGWEYPTEKLSSWLSVGVEKLVEDVERWSLKYFTQWREDIKVLNLLSSHELAEVAQALSDEVSDVLEAEYQRATFWFSPYSLSAVLSARRTLPPKVQ